MSRIHTISDIPGHAAELACLITAIGLDTFTEDKLVLLGDYIDRQLRTQ